MGTTAEANEVAKKSVRVWPLETGIFAEVSARRARQRQKHSEAHDATHSKTAWLALLTSDVERVLGRPTPSFRDVMLDVAALAVAAIEAIDRAASQDGALS